MNERLLVGYYLALIILPMTIVGIGKGIDAVAPDACSGLAEVNNTFGTGRGCTPQARAIGTGLFSAGLWGQLAVIPAAVASDSPSRKQGGRGQ